LDVEEDDSPAEIEEIKQEKEGLKVFSNFSSLNCTRIFCGADTRTCLGAEKLFFILRGV